MMNDWDRLAPFYDQMFKFDDELEELKFWSEVLEEERRREGEQFEVLELGYSTGRMSSIWRRGVLTSQAWTPHRRCWSS